MAKAGKIAWLIFAALVLLTTAICAYSLSITEVNYNPHGSDEGREGIELSNPQCLDLEGYTFLENGISHRIFLNSSGECTVSIICQECDTVESNASKFESSFSLSNQGEYVAIALNGTIIDSVNYTVNGSEDASYALFGEMWMHS